VLLVLAGAVALVSATPPFVYGAKRDNAPKPEPAVITSAGVVDPRTTAITPDQENEISSRYRECDTNSNNLLEAQELVVCMHSMGKDISRLDIAHTMIKFGGSESQLEFDGFRNYIISLYGKPNEQLVSAAFGDGSSANTDYVSAAGGIDPERIVTANLADPKPVKDKHKTPYHQPPSYVIANLKDPKPILTRKRADEGVRAHLLVREKDIDEEPKHSYVRAHVITRSNDKPKHRKRNLVIANAHITPDEPKVVAKRVREIVTANAHITPDHPRKRHHAHKHEFVTAEAHITRDTAADAAATKRAHTYVTADAHITTERRAVHHHKHKHQPDLQSADVVLFPKGHDGAPSVPAPKEEEAEPELVSADIKVV